MIENYEITGVHCESCMSKVETALVKIDGVNKATTKLEYPQAKIESDDYLNLDEVNSILSELGMYRIKEAWNR